MKSIDFFSWKIGALLYLIASILFGIEMVYAIQIKNVENIGISDLAGFLYFSIIVYIWWQVKSYRLTRKHLGKHIDLFVNKLYKKGQV